MPYTHKSVLRIHDLTKSVLIHTLEQKAFAVRTWFGVQQLPMSVNTNNNHHTPTKLRIVAQTFHNCGFSMNSLIAPPTSPRARSYRVSSNRNHLVSLDNLGIMKTCIVEILVLELHGPFFTWSPSIPFSSTQTKNEMKR